MSDCLVPSTDLQYRIQGLIVEHVYLYLRSISSREGESIKTLDDVIAGCIQVAGTLLDTDWLSLVNVYHQEVLANIAEIQRRHEQHLNSDVQCHQCCKKMKARDYRSGSIGAHSYSFLCVECEAVEKKLYIRHCLFCEQEYIAPNRNETFDVCQGCRTKGYEEECHRVDFHNERARVLGLSATLTLKQWITTLDHFDWKCAYCRGLFQGIEHFMPLSLDGTTSVNNCLPSCKRCNVRKGDKHPDKFVRFFPAENIRRIQEYLADIA